MATEKSTRRVYSAEMLHRLRSTASQPTLHLEEAIEENDDGDAELIKEHVLRGSRSFAARSWKSRTSANSLRVPSNKENRSTTASEADRIPAAPLPSKGVPVLGELVSNNQNVRSAAAAAAAAASGSWRARQSPTQSMRARKIESLVKAHGSPPHVRVTAGGRIVPSEQSPLCHPRYGYSAIKTNGGLVKFAPNHPTGKTQWTQATQNGFVAQDMDGRLCQIVNGTIMPLNEVNGAMQLFMPAPNLSVTQRGPSQGSVPTASQAAGNPPQRQSSRAPASEPSVTAQINALELEYSKLEHELKDIDKTEVLHGKTMGKAAKDALVGKRRELVMTTDNIRKALKSLKQQKPAEVPTSPRALQHKQSTSPPKNRLPPFLQQRQNPQMAPPQAACGAVYGMPQPGTFVPTYAFQPSPSPESTFAGQPWAMPPPNMFVPPPPFDGSLSSASLPYQNEAPRPMNSTLEQPVQRQAAAVGTAALQPTEHTTNQGPPRNDGARSFADLQKVASPHKSHAVPIKAPDGKKVKSSLNPMSPAYKPGKAFAPLQNDKNKMPPAQSVNTRPPTPLSPPNHESSASNQLRVVNKTDDSASPRKKSAHLHSSSVSSFETADFFPRNTREYSIRKHDYPLATDSTEKENMDPQGHESTQSDATELHTNRTRVSHAHPASTLKQLQATSPGTGPTAPPSTPADPELARQQLLSGTIDSTMWDRQNVSSGAGALPNREEHNLSPKNKRREWLFVEEHPSRQASVSPEKMHACQDELCVTSSPYYDVDFLNKPRDFVEGYQAGLNRRPPGFDRSAEFLEGYCAALMKPTAHNNASAEPSTGSPAKPISRRPSPATMQASNTIAATTDRRPNRPTLAPLETCLQSTDTLKQAMLAPHNENAILTPAADGPHITETTFNLGAWQKTRKETSAPDVDPAALQNALAGFEFPKRTMSTARRQLDSSIDKKGPKNEQLPRLPDSQPGQQLQASLYNQRSGNEISQPPASSAASTKSAALSSSASTGYRMSSMTSIDSNLYRNYPGHRVFSPHLEYKSASSVAQHAGLASGFFAGGQYDGASDLIANNPISSSQLMTGAPMIGAAASSQTQNPMSTSRRDSAAPLPPPPQHARFMEGSIDGMSNPPTSPVPGSPSMSPHPSPAKDKPKDSPNKGSPARAKFEHIAEKVGIKTLGTGKTEKETEPASPQGKRRWRDVWRTSSRKEGSGDEHQQQMPGTTPTAT
ncbi:hypothetical protein KC340_g2604 [Hortaea werneckii]|nr:hypothetical protein KC342_g2566 [Hortaea werneckii]KAI7104419.1 hypothetical protein KC339_g4561 [Hortaea werneckii]KAI7245204.1 hypothetical protein KC365_g702 [Hortaea werneckii]KAI7334190.1 hypothetical protein KC340_g2604 [Hortaea werneckii]